MRVHGCVPFPRRGRPEWRGRQGDVGRRRWVEVAALLCSGVDYWRGAAMPPWRRRGANGARADSAPSTRGSACIPCMRAMQGPHVRPPPSSHPPSLQAATVAHQAATVAHTIHLPDPPAMCLHSCPPAWATQHTVSSNGSDHDHPTSPPDASGHDAAALPTITQRHGQVRRARMLGPVKAVGRPPPRPSHPGWRRASQCAPVCSRLSASGHAPLHCTASGA